ncbi:MAG: nitroreductase family protein [Xylanivirga thermophila]|jgi:nitroreductase|uniref:nitroreductase family protein n=1 Tax=Xylanivirga thermophila TaxID=2496273 RepID=UPI00101B7ACF|nr:nitroreductase family protein [Xylanivirga thermophila]
MLDILQTRRSIRKFKNQSVEENKIDRIIKSALLSPSSMNTRPWEFVIVDDSHIISELSKCKPSGADFLSGAPLAIVVLGDENKSNAWIEDTSIASIIMQLEAHALGLGSCWIQIRGRKHEDGYFAEDYIQRLLSIPKHLRVESILAIGYPDKEKSPHANDEMLFDRVHRNSYKI